MLLITYLLGAFPTGVLLAWWHGVDLAKVGSGNIGATNVSRALGKKAGLLTLVVDTGKGLVAVLLAATAYPDRTLQIAAGVLVVAGHCFSIPNCLRGGKGVATTFGVLIAWHYEVALFGLLVFLACLKLVKIVAISSLTAMATVVAAIALLDYPLNSLIGSILIGFMVFARHRSNIHPKRYHLLF